MIGIDEKLDIAPGTRLFVPNDCLVMQCGAKAEVTGPPDREKLQVFSKHGGLIFEYDSITGKSRLEIPEGDLEISTCSGNIEFFSEKEISFFSKQSIKMESSQGIHMVTSDAANENLAAISLGSKKIGMNSPEIDINSQRCDIQIEETRYTGNKFSGRIKNIKLLMERLDSAACTVIEKAKNIYKTVEELTQLRTGRMRTIVNTTWQVKSKKAFLKAEEDFKVKGEKIHLG